MTEYLRQMCFDVIENLRAYEPSEGYYVAFSGGKDSCVILDLVKKSGVKYDAHFNFTTVDPPELVKFIKEHHPEVEIHRPTKTMFQLIPTMQLPLQQQRWCCKILKEHGGEGRVVVTGIRKQESNKRKLRESKEMSNDGKKEFCHIIIDWKETDVWDYIKSNNLPYCSLYDEGWYRIGCVGCPNSNPKTKKREFERYPNIKKAYLWAIQKMVERKPHNKLGTDVDLIFEQWISGKSTKKFLGARENLDIFNE